MVQPDLSLQEESVSALRSLFLTSAHNSLGQRVAARLLVLVVPGGFEGFFDAAQGLRSPMRAADHWQRINERWDTHVVGPPLEREADEVDG